MNLHRKRISIYHQIAEKVIERESHSNNSRPVGIQSAVVYRNQYEYDH